MLKKALILIVCSTLFFGIGRAETSRIISDLRVAAERGDAEAQFTIGGIYYTGEGVKQNYTDAVKWVRLAAEQGFSKAQYNLGEMYYKGQGV